MLPLWTYSVCQPTHDVRQKKHIYTSAHRENNASELKGAIRSMLGGHACSLIPARRFYVPLTKYQQERHAQINLRYSPLVRETPCHGDGRNNDLCMGSVTDADTIGQVVTTAGVKQLKSSHQNRTEWNRRWLCIYLKIMNPGQAMAAIWQLSTTVSFRKDSRIN